MDYLRLRSQEGKEGGFVVELGSSRFGEHNKIRVSRSDTEENALFWAKIFFKNRIKELEKIKEEKNRIKELGKSKRS